MAFNPFLGRSQTLLESDLAKCQADLAAGKTVIRADVPGISVYSQIEITITERIRQILVALNKVDPTTYPLDQISPASTTRVIFNSNPASNV